MGDEKAQTAPLNVRLPTDLLRAIDDVRDETEREGSPKKTRTDVVVELLAVGLQHRAEQGETSTAVEEMMTQLAEMGAARDAADRALLSLYGEISRLTKEVAGSDGAVGDMALDRLSLRELAGTIAAVRAKFLLRIQEAEAPIRQAPAPGLPLDDTLRARLELVAEAMSRGGIFAQMGVQVTVEQVVKLALNRGMDVLEGGGATALPPALNTPLGYGSPGGAAAWQPPTQPPSPPVSSRPGAPGAFPVERAPRPVAPGGQYARAARVTQEELDNRPTAMGSRKASDRSAVAEVTADFSDKNPDIPQGWGNEAARGEDGRFLPDPSWQAWSPDVDGEIAPEEARVHNYYSSNGWYRWSKPTPQGRWITFYWSDEARAQAIEPFKGDARVLVEPLPTDARGVAHAIAVVASR